LEILIREIRLILFSAMAITSVSGTGDPRSKPGREYLMFLGKTSIGAIV
jgi:hypothetical protein